MGYRIRVQFGLVVSGLAMPRFGRGSSSLLLPNLLPGKNDEAMEQKPLSDIRHHLHLNSTQPSVEPVWGGEWMVQDKPTIDRPTKNTGLPCLGEERKARTLILDDKKT